MNSDIPAESWLIDLATRSAIGSVAVLGVAVVAIWFCRNRSAALRHRIWLLGACSVLALPMVSLLTPEMRLAVLPPPTATASSRAPMLPATALDPFRADLARPDMPTVASFPPPLSSAIPPEPLGSNAVTESSIPSPHTFVRPATVVDEVPVAWGRWCFGMWLAGVTVLSARLIVGWIKSRRLIHRSQPISCDRGDNPDRSGLINRCVANSGIRFQVEFLRSPCTTMPFATGVLRHQIVLPESYVTWSHARCEAVVLHELAHLKRRDVMTQWIGELSCVAYWFNPLSWLTVRGLRDERECACDDQVLRWGMSSTDYAQQLLHVAKESRDEVRYPLAVAMARPKQIQSRIRHLLDPSRLRMSVCRKTAVMMLLCFACATSIVAAIRPVALAGASPQQDTTKDGGEAIDDGKAAQSNAAETASEATAIQTMTFKVVDENDQPLEDVDIHVSVWTTRYVDEPKTFPPNSDYKTGVDGIAEIRRPAELRILRIWANKPGYVPLFTHWEEHQHDKGVGIPASYRLVLQQGSRIGGQVVDSAGRPIEGATVDVRADVPKSDRFQTDFTELSVWLAEDNLTTDQGGRWSIDTAPKIDETSQVNFRLRVTHPDYVSDDQWGELQSQSHVTDEQLRDLSAKIVMPAGHRIRGKVVDENGNPVTRGIIVWNPQPYGNQSVLEAKLNTDGTFQSEVIAEGAVPLTVIAPGFQPHLEQVDVYQDMESKTIELKHGRTLRIRVTDPDGAPIPGAWVGLRGWRGMESLYNYKHSTVLDSGIPNRGGDDGMYAWNGAPSDAVKYQVAAKGFATKELELIAREGVHEIRLLPKLGVTGTVTDARTGRAIDQFKVIPVNVFRQDFVAADYNNGFSGRDGQYASETHFRGDDRSFHVRIEAEGYRAAMNPTPFHLQDGARVIDFQLEPRAPISGRVVNDDGKPVVGAEVIVSTPTVLPHLRNGYPENGIGVPSYRRTDREGAFHHVAQFEPFRLRVLHADGVAEVSGGPDAEDLGTIRLQPWSTINGQVTRDGTPMAEQRVYFTPFTIGQLGQPRFQELNVATTDNSGSYRLDRIQSVVGSIRVHLSPWEDSPLTSGKSVPVDVRSGQSINIDFGDRGAKVVGKVVPTGRGLVPLDQNYSLNYLIRRDGGVDLPSELQPQSIVPGEPIQKEWFRDPNHSVWLGSRENHFVKLSPQGQLKIDGVSAGQYDLSIRLFEKPSGCLVEAIGHVIVPVAVTEAEANSGTKDLGEIEVPCHVGPRIGASMASYRFTDPTGRVRSVAEMAGKYVMLQFWATWCSPCIESMPKIAAVERQLNPANMTFAAISLDHDPDRARQLAERHGWSWANDFVGADSDIAAELAISSVPAYYLIGPDGNLVASTGSWSEMHGEIEKLW